MVDSRREKASSRRRVSDEHRSLRPERSAPAHSRTTGRRTAQPSSAADSKKQSSSGLLGNAAFRFIALPLIVAIVFVVAGMIVSLITGIAVI